MNNAVSRVAGLLAIAVFGVVLSRGFESRMQPTLADLAPAARAQLRAELPKMAGAKVSDSVAKTAIRSAFVGSFQTVMIDTAVLAIVAALAGAAIGGGTPKRERA